MWLCSRSDGLLLDARVHSDRSHRFAACRALSSSRHHEHREVLHTLHEGNP